MKLHEFLIWTALCFVAAILLVISPMNAKAGRVLNDSLVTRPFGHHIWQEVIHQYVSSTGEVNLVDLRANPQRLNMYLDQLAAVSPENGPEYFPTAEDKLAYWINAHNAVALRLVLNRYPAEGLEDSRAFENEQRYRLGKQVYSLVMIRQKVATAYPRYPLALFTLTDYTLNAPPLHTQVFQGKNLRKQVMQVGKTNLANGSMVRFDRSNPGCVGVKLNPFLQPYAAVLMAPAGGHDEDRDVMQEEFMDGPERPKNWIDVIRPFAPPDVYADLGTPCRHRVEFWPVDATFRQFKPF